MIHLSEFELIEKIKTQFPVKLTGTLGIGDDAAVIDCRKLKNNKFLVTTDALVDGVHFISDKIDFSDLGYKSMAVNISDIAAMGGRPLYALLTLGISGRINDRQIEEFFNGINRTRKIFPFDLTGGDTVFSGTFFISVTIIGEAFDKPLLRSGAKPGDYIYVTGSVGDSAVGLAEIQNNLKYPVSDHDYFINRHYLPTPRVELIKYLEENYNINSCIDVSDGLLGDLTHIAEMSGMGFELTLEKIPVSREKIGQSFEKDEMYFIELALSGGEDYELIFTSREIIDIRKVFEITGVAVTSIGKMTEKGYSLTMKGKPVELSNIRKSFSHF